MIFDAASFVFKPPLQVAFARRVLIKPEASVPLPHPMTTSRETLAAIIHGIRQVSQADIILLEGGRPTQPVHRVFHSLGYDFPRVIVTDVQDCVLVEVENPLTKSFALPTLWVPNVVLSCDYLISVAAFKVIRGQGSFSIRNLLGLLPYSKYSAEMAEGEMGWERLGLSHVIADLYFTVPFDLGIIDGRQKFLGTDGAFEGVAMDYGKILVGDPYEVDLEACGAAGVGTEYLQHIAIGKASLAFEGG